MDDITRLPGRDFYRAAWRLPHYETVTRAWMLAEQEDRQPQHYGAAGGGQRTDAQGRRVVAATPQAIAADPILGKLFSFGTGG